MIDPTVRSSLGDYLDRVVRSLEGRPDVAKVAPATVQHLTPITDCVQTFIVQTYRVRGEGDTATVQFVSADGSIRMVLPAPVLDCLNRQREALSTKNRKAAARATAQARKAAGIQPAFLKAKKRGPKK